MNPRPQQVSPSLGKVLEGNLPRLVSLEQRADFPLNHRNPLGIIGRQTIFLYQLIRNIKVFFDAASIDSQRQSAVTLRTLAH